MSLPKKDVPLQLSQWAHTVLTAKFKMTGAKSLKALCEAVLEREAAKEAMAARYLSSQMESKGVEPSDWERYAPRSTDFGDTDFHDGAA